MRSLWLTCLLLVPVHAGDIDPVLVSSVLDMKNKKDPVSGAKVTPGKSVELKGVRIHVANDENRKKLAAEPAKYVARLGLALDKNGLDLKNKSCPVTDGKVDGKHFADLGRGWRVRVSGPKAKAAVEKDPIKTLAKLGYVYTPEVIDLRNMSCPVTGDRCYAEAPIWVDHDGVRIRMCCDQCIAEFRAEPKRCFQALMVDPKKLKKRYGSK